MDFYNFFTIHIFKVEEYIAGIHTELPCLVIVVGENKLIGDLENPGQLILPETQSSGPQIHPSPEVDLGFRGQPCYLCSSMCLSPLDYMLSKS